MNKTYYYKGKPYRIVTESKIKWKGLRELLAGLGYSQQTAEEFDDMERHFGLNWIDVVIYECLYENPDRMVWVRTKEQFFELFKPEQ